MRKQQVLLEDEPDGSLFCRNVLRGGAVLQQRAIKTDVAAGDGDEPCQRAQQRRLAGAVRPEERHHLAAADLECDIEVQRTQAQLHLGFQRHAVPSQR